MAIAVEQQRHHHRWIERRPTLTILVMHTRKRHQVSLLDRIEDQPDNSAPVGFLGQRRVSEPRSLGISRLVGNIYCWEYLLVNGPAATGRELVCDIRRGQLSSWPW